MFGGTGFAIFGALHYWFPKIWGRMYNVRRANIAFTIQFIGFNLLYFPMLVVGLMGMPRRYYDYLPEFHLPNLISTVGSWVLILGLLMMLWNLLAAARRGSLADRNPWHGVTLEWQTKSPPPLQNFDKAPVLSEHGPYDFNQKT
jgi:cytochrome c oxidase subunit 1